MKRNERFLETDRFSAASVTKPKYRTLRQKNSFISQPYETGNSGDGKPRSCSLLGSQLQFVDLLHLKMYSDFEACIFLLVPLYRLQILAGSEIEQKRRITGCPFARPMTSRMLLQRGRDAREAGSFKVDRLLCRFGSPTNVESQLLGKQTRAGLLQHELCRILIFCKPHYYFINIS